MYFDDIVAIFDKERQEHNIFHDLMMYRVHEILLVASLYDSYILESDGSLFEQIYGEYYKLNLTSAPRVTSAYTYESTLELLSIKKYDLVIIMASIDVDSPIELTKKIKKSHEDLPILLLAMNNSILGKINESCFIDNKLINRVFVWNGYSKLFVAMVKYIEDLYNVDNDTQVGLVRVILLIEDSIRYYSRYLPILYSVIMRQTQLLIEEESQIESYKILRMRGRPKVLLATSFEEAMDILNKYEPYILTIISDVKFPHGGIEDPDAGIKLVEIVKNKYPDLPVMLQSSENENKKKAYDLKAAFADKNSNTLGIELNNFFQENLGFGPFIFRDSDGNEINRARTLKEFEDKIQEIPSESILYHAKRNHFSAWLMARGEIKLAKKLKKYNFDDFNNFNSVKIFLKNTLDNLKKEKLRGTIPEISAGIDLTLGIARLGAGSVGGKGRGLAFIKSLIDFTVFNNDIISVKIPLTIFIGIDEFEKFMDKNNLWEYAWHSSEDELFDRFLNAELDSELVKRLKNFIDISTMPLAVRSSGLFEDMLIVPFSGVYDTYVIPNTHPNNEKRLKQLCDAIKSVYVSLFSKRAQEYFETACYKIEEERMAIIIQELVGSKHGHYFYPLLAGTAQSYNYYPVSHIKPEDGLCIAALGFGHYVVEGEQGFIFSPKYSKIDIVNPRQRMSGSQRWFYALDLDKTEINLKNGETSTLTKLEIDIAESSNPKFHLLASTWNTQDERLEPGITCEGIRVIDLAPILKYEAVALPATITHVLEIFRQSMGIPVEIEWAFDYKDDNPVFYLLQIKPLIQNIEKRSIKLDAIQPDSILVETSKCMGNGYINSIYDFIYIDPRKFDKSKTHEIALELEQLNHQLKSENRHYILLGFGRWGTRDKWLGVPVTYNQISNAKIIIEADLEDFRVDCSLGSHFFHNVIAMNIGYFSVPWNTRNARINWNKIKELPVHQCTKYLVHIRTQLAFDVIMEGTKSRGIITPPGVHLPVHEDDSCA